MDSKQRVSDEQPCDELSHSYTVISGLTYKPLDPEDQLELYKFLPEYYQYWLEVNEEDMSTLVEFDVFGKIESVPRVEAYYYYRKNDGAKVQVVYDKGEIVAFMLYYNIYDCVIAIDAMWAREDYLNKGLGKHMINSLNLPIRKVIFQTRKKKPPGNLLRVTDKHRKLLNERTGLFVWEMPWPEVG